MIDRLPEDALTLYAEALAMLLALEEGRAQLADDLDELSRLAGTMKAAGAASVSAAEIEFEHPSEPRDSPRSCMGRANLGSHGPTDLIESRRQEAA